MKRRFILIILISYFYLAISPDSGLCQSGLSDMLEDILDDVVYGSMEKKRAQYDTISFGYALSLNYDPGLFETKKGLERQVKSQLAAHKYLDTWDNMEKARILVNNAEKAAARGKFKMAEHNYNRAKKILEKKEERMHTPVYSRTVADLGLLYYNTGRYTIAEEFTRQSLNLRKETVGDKTIAYASSLNNLGVIQKDLGNYNAADSLLTRSLDITRNSLGGEGFPCAVVLNNLGVLYHIMGRAKEAEQLMQEALDIAGNNLREKSSRYRKS